MKWRIEIRADQDNDEAIAEFGDLDRARGALLANVQESLSQYTEGFQITPGESPYHGWDETAADTSEMSTFIRAEVTLEGIVG